MNHANNVFEMLTIDKVKGKTFETQGEASEAMSETMGMIGSRIAMSFQVYVTHVPTVLLFNG